MSNLGFRESIFRNENLEIIQPEIVNTESEQAESTGATKEHRTT